MKGRKPKPTRIHILQGGRKKTHRPLPKDEPQPELLKSCPDPPDYLSLEAKKEWKRVAKYLFDAGLITHVDVSALSAYCEAFSRWVDCCKKINQTGMLVKAPSGYPMQTPLLSIANAAFKQMVTMLTEFGMTPSSRSRLKVEKPKQEDELDKFIKRSKK